jgi:hypothetical protein
VSALLEQQPLPSFSDDWPVSYGPSMAVYTNFSTSQKLSFMESLLTSKYMQQILFFIPHGTGFELGACAC